MTDSNETPHLSILFPDVLHLDLTSVRFGLGVALFANTATIICGKTPACFEYKHPFDAFNYSIQDANCTSVQIVF